MTQENDKKTHEFPVVDDVVIERLRELESPDDEIPFSRQMIQGFIAGAPEMLEALQKALVSSDEKELKYWSHKLYGFAMNIGGSRFALKCKEIELNPGNFSGSTHMAEELNKQYSVLCEALKKY